jgi:hypothetical protein
MLHILIIKTPYIMQEKVTECDKNQFNKKVIDNYS